MKLVRLLLQAFGPFTNKVVDFSTGPTDLHLIYGPNEAGKSYYPRRYVTGTLSLQLTKDLAPGEYTILLRIQDGIGNQQSESKHSFRVE